MTMEVALQNFDRWLKNVKETEILSDLAAIKDNFQEIEERFSENIKFGTAGLRGIMSSGSNRMNIYTVKKATQGLANYLNSKYKNACVAISYDCRNNSELFAHETAAVMAANGIKSYVTSELTPTPFLSYCVRKLGAQAGVMITASHNTAEYNGYKCYGSDGSQMNENFADEVYKYIENVDIFSDVKCMNFANGVRSNKIEFIGKNLIDNYLNDVLSQKISGADLKDLNVTYTPLNGTGAYFVKKIFKMAGVENFAVVPSQENPDGNFTTCPYPNPEIPEAFSESLKVANENNSDIILATDPDADRLGVCIKNGADYKILSGNEIGILLLNYILECKSKSKTLPKRGVVVKTVVSTLAAEKIAEDYGCQVKNVLTGFKNIAYEIFELEKSGNEKDFVFGFEESNGYLCGSYVRDKDAVSAAMLVCEMAAYYKNEFGLDLSHVLEKIYSKYGYFGEKTLSYEFKGILSRSKIEQIMEFFRKSQIKNIGEFKVESVVDYLNFDGNMKSNVVQVNLENVGKLIIRPSGTEPKIKFYVLIKSFNEDIKNYMMKNLCEFVNDFIQNIRH